MTNTFWQETKEILSEFLYETKGYAAWVAKEVKRQYHLSILKEIALTYPETTLHINKAYEIVDGVPLDCPDFVEPPKRTNIESDFHLDSDPFYAPKDIEDGLNEPRYPYDTEPSA